MTPRQTALAIICSLLALVLAYTVFQPKPPVPKDKAIFKVYFAQQKGDEVVLTGVDRKFPVDQDWVLPERQLKWITQKLLEGPSEQEKQLGLYTEIPKKTTVNGVEGKDNKLYLDLEATFAQGAGSNTLIERVEQVKKTVADMPNRQYPVYLMVEGKLLEAVGSESLEIDQPIAAGP